MVQHPLDKKNGYITLMSVLIVSSIGVSIALSLVLLGLGSSKSSLALERSTEARGLANACAEQALQEIRNSTAYTGTGNLTLGQGTCVYTVTDMGAETRLITATGQVNETIRKLKITIDVINPQINISSWQELADF